MQFILVMIATAIGGIILYNNFTLRRYVDIQRVKFPHPFFDYMYQLSYSVPFRWFVDDDENPTKKRTIEVKKLLQKSGYDRYFTLRSYLAFKVYLLLILLFVGVVILTVIHYWEIVGSVIFGVSVEKVAVSASNVFFIFAFLLLLALLPDQILKIKAKTKQKEETYDFTHIQMFIILMLQSKKTVGEILHGISKLNTPYKEDFEKSYRIYARNKNEGFQFLKERFSDYQFIDTLKLLEDLGEYARVECIRILEEDLDGMIEENSMKKRRKDLSTLILSETSMFVPFLAVLIFGALPLLSMGINLFIGAFEQL